MREHRDLIAERTVTAGEFAADRRQIRGKLLGFDISDTRHPQLPRPPRSIAAPPHRPSSSLRRNDESVKPGPAELISLSG